MEETALVQLSTADRALESVRTRVAMRNELRTKALQLQPLSGRAGWWSVIRESYTGAWQRNDEIAVDNVLTYYAIYSCIRLISTDVGKMCLRLVEEDRDGVWSRTESPAFSPVLRKPNRYQTINKYIEQYILSKLLHGNAYVLKERDNRGVVTALYVLDASRVTPLVSSDGSVYYELKRDDLSGLSEEQRIFPASEIIHDTMIAPFHPLIGLSPLYACGLAALQGLSIQNNSKKFFDHGANPSGMLTAPGAIDDGTAARLKAHFESGAYSGEKSGAVIVAGDGLKYEQFTMSAVDAQLVEQLRMTAEQVCSAFGVPPYLVDIGPPPPYANFEPLVLKYHSTCIQSLTVNFEKCHDDGLGIGEKINGRQYGTEFDIDDLIWMDTATRMTAAQTSIRSGLTPNEVRKKYHGVGRVSGGDAVYMQQQDYSIEALAERDADAPFAKPEPQRQLPEVTDEPVDEDADEDLEKHLGELLRKELELVQA
jgi:HK97 family phage portal protein